MSRISPQLICFSYHKSGTTLLWHVMTKISERLGLRLVNHYGLVRQLDPEPDLVLLPHSVLRAPLDRPYRAIRLIRDPRDIWVSGYLYHLRCDEGWCLCTDTNRSAPIRWPQVDYSVLHWPEDWKLSYLDRLGGKSYQQNLLDRSLADGLDFELEGYTGCTLATMREWKLNGADALDLKLEEVMADFDGAMQGIFDHFGFSADQSRAALEVARSEDVRRMDDAAIADRPQINSRTISKWREVLSTAQIARFEERYGDLIRELGYEAADAAPSSLADARVLATDAGMPPARQEVEPLRSRLARRSAELGPSPPVLKTTRDADIRLSADGAPIRPTATGRGTYSFVVPPGRVRILLESRFNSCLRDLGGARLLGVKVSEIAIRSSSGEVVIAADDPRLTTGWHDVEQAGGALWRWTNGSAKLPWDDVSGPAMVLVRCMTLLEYPISHEAGGR